LITESVRGRSLMRVISETSLVLLQSEVEAMSPGEAGEVWAVIEPLFKGVCARASGRSGDSSWLMMVRKMQLIRRRAEADGA
jgi:hypothetical protein